MAPSRDGKRPRAGPVDHRRLLVEQLVDALGRGQAFQRRRRHRAQRLDGLRRQQQRGDETHEIADRADAVGDTPIGEGDDAGNDDPCQRLEGRTRAAARADRLDAQLVDLLEIAVQPLYRVVLEAKRLDEAGAGELLSQPRRHIAELALGATRHRAQPPADAPDRQRRQRIEGEHDEGEHPVQVEHGAEDGDHRQDILDEGDHGNLGGLLNERQIVGQPRDEMARGLAREAGEVGIDEVGEGRLLDVGGHAHDDARRRHLVEIEEDAACGRHDDDGDQHPRQRAAVALHQRVERVLDDERIAAGGGCQARW